ncbi:MAG: polyprenol monophosphomannose synthase [Candidatus Aureabacteria bacterium]|nr:polyprenol monophosphomannose synthase [Candidatus Auribacterota bacterium]
MNKCLIIIPTYNESKNIVRLCEKIMSMEKGFDILVVDDNSPDGTGELAEKMSSIHPEIHVISRPAKMGIGSAYIEGFKWGLGKEYELFFEMDADFSHNPEDLIRMAETVKDCDLCVGSRYIEGGGVINWPLWRMLLSKFAARYYTSIITRMPMNDATSGFKCFRRTVLENLALDEIHSEGYSFQIEMHYRVWKKGFRIKEIPIIFTDRQHGLSKMSKKIIFEAIIIVWKIKFTVK